MMHQPFTGEKYLATAYGAWLELSGKKTPLKTSGVKSLGHATLMTTDPYLFEGQEFDVFTALRSACRLTRYGFDCYAYAMIAVRQYRTGR